MLQMALDRLGVL